MRPDPFPVPLKASITARHSNRMSNTARTSGFARWSPSSLFTVMRTRSTATTDPRFAVRTPSHSTRLGRAWQTVSSARVSTVDPFRK